jgi:hypothetical protein
VVAHIYNHNYLEVEIGVWFEASPGNKMSARPYIKDKPGMVMQHTCNASYMGGSSRKNVVQGWPGQKEQDPV